MVDIRTTIAAFSEEHAERLSGVSKSQLRYWDRTGFYKPSYGHGKRREAFSRIYSFRDIVALRVLNVLRNKHGVPLKRLREVGEKLNKYADDRWTAIRLWALNKEVIWQEPGTGRPEEVVNQQGVVTEVMESIIAETAQGVAKLSARDQSKEGVVEQSRYVNHNQPVLGGTRIPVSAIKRFSEAGYNTAQILKEYPDLTEKDIEAALAYKSRRAA